MIQLFVMYPGFERLEALVDGPPKLKSAKVSRVFIPPFPDPRKLSPRMKFRVLCPPWNLMVSKNSHKLYCLNICNKFSPQVSSLVLGDCYVSWLEGV